MRDDDRDDLGRIPFLRELGISLRQAAAVEDARAASAGASPRRWWMKKASVVFGAGAIVLGGAAVSAATGLWNPPLGNDDAGHASRGYSDVPADQLASFEVLRRGATDADRDAAAANALRYLDDAFVGVRVERIRAPAGAPSDRYLIVPVERSELAGVDNALCLFAADPAAAGGGVGCWSSAEIERGHAAFIELPTASSTNPTAGDLDSLRPSTANAAVVGLVPDGVARVRLGPVSTAVNDNFFSLPLPAGASAPDVVWEDADGAVITK